MTLLELYDEAEKSNIMVVSYDFKTQPCLSIMNNNGDCFIGIDPIQLQSELQEKIQLSHELGHCLTGSFYNKYSPLSIKGQCEHRANIWAIKKLIPKNEYEQALKSGYIEMWSLAEYFEVTEEFMQKAVDFYTA